MSPSTAGTTGEVPSPTEAAGSIGSLVGAVTAAGPATSGRNAVVSPARPYHLNDSALAEPGREGEIMIAVGNPSRER